MKNRIPVRILGMLLAIALISSGSHAESFRKVGTSAAQFLKIGVGARALALGGAYAGIADDVDALYWNPAGIVHVNTMSWTGTHTNWLADVKHQFTGLVVPMGQGASLGFSATFVTMDKVEITTESEPRGTGFYWDANDIAVGLTYARWMTDRIAVGVTGKYISQKIWNESASTFAVDVGTYLTTGYKGIVIGMCFSNFGGNMQLAGRDLIREYDYNPENSLNTGVDTRLFTQPWPLPVNFRVGLSMEVVGAGDRLYPSENSRLTVAVDGNHPNDDSEKVNCGVEYSWKEILFTRVGYGLGYDLMQFSYGLGLKVNISDARFSFDYALAPFQELGTIHYFTVGLSF